ncbi:MAG: transaldolase family protein [Bacillota bacterium]|nr:transaldolase family protein [Bacillota bacterium]
MHLLLDSGAVDEIREASSWGVIRGATTNPTLLRQAGVEKISDLVASWAAAWGTLHVEVFAAGREGMVEQALRWTSLGKPLAIKVPCTPSGLAVCRELAQRQIPVNVTLVFSLSQALLAAEAGASYVSPFVGRMEDHGMKGVQLVADIRNGYDRTGVSTQILAASLRNPRHVEEVALAGAHWATMPMAVLQKLFHHPLTDDGLQRFSDDAAHLQD